MIDKMNVRVYAAILKDGKVMVLHEEYVGQQLLKFPGGGLELGEGVLECVQRELEEELNIKVKNIEHLYTQEDFLASKFRAGEQLLSIYYVAEMTDENDLLIIDPCIEKIEWISLDTEENPFPLPIDNIAFEKLKQRFL
ncbi:NUDIX hydrolase [Kaistella carnis]|uniref:NUDIX hydrolase n=1 Tax=Kaistella carnis TaxID=1241979 RepID=UPI00289F0171|nr:NUDIX hydrolase [Kaistella carnis]